MANSNSNKATASKGTKAGNKATQATATQATATQATATQATASHLVAAAAAAPAVTKYTNGKAGQANVAAMASQAGQPLTAAVAAALASQRKLPSGGNTALVLGPYGPGGKSAFTVPALGYRVACALAGPDGTGAFTASALCVGWLMVFASAYSTGNAGRVPARYAAGYIALANAAQANGGKLPANAGSTLAGHAANAAWHIAGYLGGHGLGKPSASKPGHGWLALAGTNHTGSIAHQPPANLVAN